MFIRTVLLKEAGAPRAGEEGVKAFIRVTSALAALLGVDLGAGASMRLLGRRLRLCVSQAGVSPQWFGVTGGPGQGSWRQGPAGPETPRLLDCLLRLL